MAADCSIQRDFGGGRSEARFAAPVPLLLQEARRRWAELLRRIFEVDPLACPRCGSAMRMLALVTEPAVIARILTHRRTQAPAAPARAPPSSGSPGAPERSPERSGPRARRNAPA